MSLTVGSLFSGIGGLDLGFEWAGFRTVFQVEIDPKATAVLRRHWPDVTRFQDIRAVTTFPHCDVLVGGFPCQDISHANTNAEGLKGSKSGLWSEYRRAIQQVRPSYVIVENVAALRYCGRGLGTILGDLADIGYDAEWTVLPAALAGAPHKRARFWLVAYPNRDRKPNMRIDAETQVLSEPCDPGWSWADPPASLRVDDGVPRELDGPRRVQLGNGVVPAAAYYIARQVMAHWNAAVQ